MRRRRNLPGQLALHFEENGSYLGWLEFKMEKDDEFEKTAQKLLLASHHEGADGPIWHEIACALKH